MEAQPQLLLLQKNMLMAEGVSRALNPTLNIWTLAQPLIEQWMRENRGPEARLRERWKTRPSSSPADCPRLIAETEAYASIASPRTACVFIPRRWRRCDAETAATPGISSCGRCSCWRSAPPSALRSPATGGRGRIMSLTAAAARGALWSMLETWGVRGVSFVAFLVLARLISPDDFGLMALASIYLMRLSSSSTRVSISPSSSARRLEPEHLDAAFWINVAIGLVARPRSPSLVAGLVADLYGEPRLAPLLRVLALLPVITSLTLVQRPICGAICASASWRRARSYRRSPGRRWA